jgi:hypothetical protein
MDTINRLLYAVLNYWIFNELQRMWKEMIKARFEIVFWYFQGPRNTTNILTG